MHLRVFPKNEDWTHPSPDTARDIPRLLNLGDDNAVEMKNVWDFWRPLLLLGIDHRPENFWYFIPTPLLPHKSRLITLILEKFSR